MKNTQPHSRLQTTVRPVEGVYRIDPDGGVTRIITREVNRPNGIAISADDAHLFAADNTTHVSGGARKLWRFHLRDDGLLPWKE